MTNEIYDNLKLARLVNEHQEDLVSFDCVDHNEDFGDTRAKKIRKYISYSESMNEFLRDEAMQEQNAGLNTTHILLHKNKVIGFISLCTDSIRLELDERKQSGVPYANIPALKIARLGIDNKFQGKGLGRFMIKYAVSISSQIRDLSGVKFITVDCYKHRLSYYTDEGFVVNKVQRPNREPDSPLSLRLHIDRYLEEMHDTISE